MNDYLEKRSITRDNMCVSKLERFVSGKSKCHDNTDNGIDFDNFNLKLNKKHQKFEIELMFTISH